MSSNHLNGRKRNAGLCGTEGKFGSGQSCWTRAVVELGASVHEGGSQSRRRKLRSRGS